MLQLSDLRLSPGGMYTVVVIGRTRIEPPLETLVPLRSTYGARYVRLRIVRRRPAPDTEASQSVGRGGPTTFMSCASNRRRFSSSVGGPANLVTSRKYCSMVPAGWYTRSILAGPSLILANV
jgi:hypothetical protein